LGSVFIFRGRSIGLDNYKWDAGTMTMKPRY
jgi:hypothetical protein